jgi:hypothetical protein
MLEKRGRSGAPLENRDQVGLGGRFHGPESVPEVTWWVRRLAYQMIGISACGVRAIRSTKWWV